MDEEDGRSKYGGQEIAFLSKPAVQILHSVHRGVYLATQLCFDTVKEFGDSLKADIANDHYVHVTFRAGFSRSNRSIDEGDVNFSPSRLEGFAQYFNHTYGFDQDLFEFREYWALTMGLIVNAISIDMTLQESGIGKGRKITLNTRRLQMKVPGKFSKVPSFGGPKNRGRQNCLFGRGKQWI